MFKIGTKYRYSPRNQRCDQQFVRDSNKPINLPNYHYETKEGFCFERGIHVSKATIGPDRIKRIPVIIITSSPFKAGSESTPWKDLFAPDHGYIKYYGDSKENKKPEEPNNSFVLEQLNYNDMGQEQRKAFGTPFVFFERESKGIPGL